MQRETHHNPGGQPITPRSQHNPEVGPPQGGVAQRKRLDRLACFEARRAEQALHDVRCLAVRFEALAKRARDLHGTLHGTWGRLASLHRGHQASDDALRVAVDAEVLQQRYALQASVRVQERYAKRRYERARADCEFCRAELARARQRLKTHQRRRAQALAQLQAHRRVQRASAQSLQHNGIEEQWQLRHYRR